MNQTIMDILSESLAVKEQAIKDNTDLLVRSAEMLAACISAGHKVFLFGNGGSAADAQHIAAEFVNRFQIERPPLAAIALTTDTSIMTSIANDYCFDDIFAKQIRALGQKNDIAIGISTSGNSPNVVRALEAAQTMGIATVAITGRGGEVVRFADVTLKVAADTTARIQETHILMAHILCDLVDRILFPEKI